MIKTRKEIAELIVENLQKNKESLQKQFLETKKDIGFFYLDNLLPDDLCSEIHQKFPELSEAEKKKDLREFKHIAYQMNKYDKLLEEVIYAFQEENVVRLISGICEIKKPLPDENLYAGGLSLMAKDNYLNPHLDNSHDKDRNLWRVLNLLYYVTPNWSLENGGNLELWPNGIKNNPLVLTSKFNRLIVMATHQHSWHSVNKVVIDRVRCCVSNYYFSKTPLLKEDKFHVTLFRARASEKGKDILLKIDNFVRSSVRKVLKKGVRENPHQYKK
ncbi:2OG-Fe(II) oxygenase [Polaribacter sp. WD7]|uniref:2OG-Fe(II) oxygenase n=1 Tax=Polaribacter sp. WD7 TaxID=2269061 RepID=UPI000DF1D59B|nr:2OG-Fe(II) oxygenase [Polaribacter sp. WD7]RCS26635.1 2OG-Fe(II) oxygenase [Polaribacter sp. WD7]